MKFNLATTSYNPEFPLESDIRQVEDVLYADIPPEIRSKFVEDEKFWTLRRVDKEDKPQSVPLEKEYVTVAFPSTSMAPVGINSHLAVGISNMAISKQHKIAIELEQYHLFWKFQLKRCRFKAQFEEKKKQLMANTDQNLKLVVEMILRDEDLIKHRDSLPDVLIDEGGLNDDYTEREDSKLETGCTIYQVPPTSPISPEGSGEIYSFYYLRYNTLKHGWKCSSHVFASPALPGYAICELFLLYAFYREGGSICVRLCRFDRKVPVGEWEIQTLGDAKSLDFPLLQCSVNNSGWMAVSNGTTVYQKFFDSPVIYSHKIQNQVVSSIHLDEYGYLFVGTTNGQIYDIGPNSIRTYTKDRDLLAILNISTSGGKKVSGQTISSILVQEPQKSFNIVRPITSIIRGTLVIFLTKYGSVRMRSLIHDAVGGDFPPLEGMTANIDTVMPWYDRGIYFDGIKLATLYPNGQVVVRIIKDQG